MTTFSFLAPGSFEIRDNGNPGDGISSIFKDGAFIQNFAHPADELVFRASVPGITITFNLTESLGTADLRIETPPASTQLPESLVVRAIRTSGEVLLIANNSIVEGGNDASVDIRAGSLILSAGTGIGTAANAIETQTGQLEAETDSGGINLSNVGAVSVGGLTDDVAGLHVASTGDIRLVNLGTISLVDETAADSVRGGSVSGDVILTAIGFDADVQSIVDQSSILAQGGDILLTAGRDVLFGRTGSNFNNDVRADGDIVVNAGRNFELSGFADFFADGVSGTQGGSVIVNAGQNISLLDANGTSAGLRSSGSAGGDVILTTGPNGVFTHQTAGSNAVTSFSGDVVVNADRMVIAGTSGITAFGQTILRPVTPGREIVLGSLSDAADALELSDGELDRIFGDRLVVGGADAGPVRVGAPITTPGNIDEWTVHSGTDVWLEASVTVNDLLSVIAGDNIFQTAGTLQATDLNVLVGQVDNGDGAGGTNILLGTLAVTTRNIFGGAGGDTLLGTDLSDVINGGDGDDRLIGGDGNDQIDGGIGNDILLGGAGADLLGGGVGSDTADYADATSEVRVNLLIVGAQNTKAAGSDTLVGIENVVTGTGNDSLWGTNGANRLESGAGNDRLIARRGNDTLVGGTGNDLLDGGDDSDTASYAEMTGAVEVNLLVVGAQNTQAGGTDTLVGIENVVTGAGNDTIRGTNGVNRLEGGDGNDRLFGRRGNDILIGGDGDDQLDGGLDNDQLDGGGGADRFIFSAALGAANVGHVLDFVVGEDRVVLENAFFTGLATGALPAGAFRAGTAAADADDRILYDAATGELRFDADGSGAGAAVLFAVLDNQPASLSASDFLVI